MTLSAHALAGDRRFVALATVAALVVRIAYALNGGPIAWPDTATYWQAGRELLAGQRIESHFVMPLYPLFLVATGWRGAVPLQLLLSALEVPLVYLLAREVFGHRAGARAAAALMVVEPLSVFYASQRLTETLFTFLVCLALLALYQRRLVLGSLVLVVSLLVRPTFDLLAPILVLVFGVRDAAPGRKAAAAARAVTLYALLYALVMSPWWLHNALKYDHFVRLNLGDGIVLRMEHNPLFVQWGFSGGWSHLAPIVNEFADEPDPIRRNALRRAAALRFIADDPARYLELSLRRLGRLWSPVIDQSEDSHWFPERWRWLSLAAACVVYAGVLAYAAQQRSRKWRSVAPLLLVILYLTAVHVATHATVRYRTPLMPLVVVISGEGWRRLMRRRDGHGDGSDPGTTLGSEAGFDVVEPARQRRTRQPCAGAVRHLPLFRHAVDDRLEQKYGRGQ